MNANLFRSKWNGFKGVVSEVQGKSIQAVSAKATSAFVHQFPSKEVLSC
jgi:hypothetical protein